MALKKPLVLSGGQIEQLQSGDTLDATANNPSSLTATNKNASTITIGQAVYQKSTAGQVDLAKADAVGTTKVLGLVSAATIAADATGAIQTDGVLSCADWTAVIGSANLTAGAQYFLSPADAGKLTATAPSTAGQFVCPVGVAISTTDLEITIHPTIKL